MFYEKGLFTTIPNLSLLSGKTPQLQVLFMWLCHHANQDGVCFPSQSLLAKECGMTKITVIKYLKELVLMDIISYEQRNIEGQKENDTNIYKIQIGSKGDLPPSKGGLQGVVKEVYYPSKGGLQRTKTNELKPIELKGDGFKNKSDTFKYTMRDFVDMRKKIKAPMTDRAIELMAKRLDKFSSDESVQIKILEQSIINGWKDVYELKGGDVIDKNEMTKENIIAHFIKSGDVNITRKYFIKDPVNSPEFNRKFIEITQICKDYADENDPNLY
jgi:hypothetical protein